jgi:hypothetical protein
MAPSLVQHEHQEHGHHREVGLRNRLRSGRISGILTRSSWNSASLFHDNFNTLFLDQCAGKLPIQVEALEHRDDPRRWRQRLRSFAILHLHDRSAWLDWSHLQRPVCRVLALDFATKYSTEREEARATAAKAMANTGIVDSVDYQLCHAIISYAQLPHPFLPCTLPSIQPGRRVIAKYLEMVC